MLPIAVLSLDPFGIACYAGHSDEAKAFRFIAAKTARTLPA
jgi:hypothetical protein